MIDRETDVIAAIEANFSVTATSKGSETVLEFENVSETFYLSAEHNEFTIYTDTWHEHFSTISELLEFLDGLFSGSIWIIVKYRGETPVGHQSQKLQNEKINVVSCTGSLLSPFWRPKIYKTKKYNIVGQSDESSEKHNPDGLA